MPILYNGKNYSGVNVTNYTAAPDYARMSNVKDKIVGDDGVSKAYIPTNNGFLLFTDINIQTEESGEASVSYLPKGQSPISVYQSPLAKGHHSFTVPLTANLEYVASVNDGDGQSAIGNVYFVPYSANIPIDIKEPISASELDGIIPEKNGGTGTDTGFNFRNAYYYGDIINILKITAPVTTYEFLRKLNYSSMSIYNVPKGTNEGALISDIPANGLLVVDCGTNEYTIHAYLLLNDSKGMFYYSCEGGQPSTWLEIQTANGIRTVQSGGTGRNDGISDAAENAFLPKINTPVASSLNNVIKNGFYRIQEGFTDGPTQTSVNYGQLLVINGNGGDTVAQIAFTYYTDRMFIRVGSGAPNTVWQPWVEIAKYGEDFRFKSGTVEAASDNGYPQIGFVTPSGNIAIIKWPDNTLKITAYQPDGSNIPSASFTSDGHLVLPTHPLGVPQGGTGARSRTGIAQMMWPTAKSSCAYAFVMDSWDENTYGHIHVNNLRASMGIQASQIILGAPPSEGGDANALYFA